MKAMRTSEEEKWFEGEYPYDLATCGRCLTHHKLGFCGLAEHEEMVRAALELLPSAPGNGSADELADRKVFTNLRELFRHFYPQQPQKEEQHEQQPEAATAT